MVATSAATVRLAAGPARPFPWASVSRRIRAIFSKASTVSVTEGI
jgi:hypothetical protein